jgi:UDP-GlcNAc3NAcA epimerase
MKCFILGTRPEWIHLRSYLDQEKLAKSELTIVNTGQHKDYRMAMQFVEELELPKPNFNLNSSPIDAGKLLSVLPEIFRKCAVSQVFVIGDTDSAFVGALGAYRSKIPLVHIEAGLRCDEPIPEEHNRRCIDSLAGTLLAPESYAVQNLRREHAVGKIVRSPNYKVLIFRKLAEELNREVPQEGNPRCLLTLHRQENVDSRPRLSQILEYLSKEDCRILWPIHPRTSSMLHKFGLRIPSNVSLCPPLSYESMIKALIASRKVFTDSGGLVLEAFELKKELVIFRKSIEWKHVWKSASTHRF